jgi:hypothetical protein
MKKFCTKWETARGNVIEEVAINNNEEWPRII